MRQACHPQSFLHKIDEKLKILPHATLQELKFIAEFIGELDSNTLKEAQKDIVDHIKKKRFPKISEQALSGSDSSLHLSLQYDILRFVLMEKTDNIEETIVKEVFEECLEHIQSGGLYAVPSILILVSKISGKIDQSILNEFMHLGKSAVFDLRRNVQFWPAFSGWSS